MSSLVATEARDKVAEAASDTTNVQARDEVTKVKTGDQAGDGAENTAGETSKGVASATEKTANGTGNSADRTAGSTTAS